MKLEEIKKRFAQLVPSLNHAAQVCQSETSAPKELRENMEDLVRCFEQGREWVEKSMDEEAVHRCIDELEEKSDRARRACDTSSAVSRELKSAVSVAHDQISELKQQMH